MQIWMILVQQLRQVFHFSLWTWAVEDLTIENSQVATGVERLRASLSVHNRKTLVHQSKVFVLRPKVVNACRIRASMRQEEVTVTLTVCNKKKATHKSCLNQ